MWKEDLDQHNKSKLCFDCMQQELLIFHEPSFSYLWPDSFELQITEIDDKNHIKGNIGWNDTDGKVRTEWPHYSVKI